MAGHLVAYLDGACPVCSAQPWRHCRLPDGSVMIGVVHRARGGGVATDCVQQPPDIRHVDDMPNQPPTKHLPSEATSCCSPAIEYEKMSSTTTCRKDFPRLSYVPDDPLVGRGTGGRRGSERCSQVGGRSAGMGTVRCQCGHSIVRPGQTDRVDRNGVIEMHSAGQCIESDGYGRWCSIEPSFGLADQGE